MVTFRAQLKWQAPMFIIRFLLVLIVIVVVLRAFFRHAFPWLLKRWLEKKVRDYQDDPSFQQTRGNSSVQSSGEAQEKNRWEDDWSGGDYIDYEEVDDE